MVVCTFTLGSLDAPALHHATLIVSKFCVTTWYLTLPFCLLLIVQLVLYLFCTIEVIFHDKL